MRDIDKHSTSTDTYNFKKNTTNHLYSSNLYPSSLYPYYGGTTDYTLNYGGTTAATTINLDSDWVINSSEHIRQMIRGRMAPTIHMRRRRALAVPVDLREMRARQTLHRVIGERAFKRFLRDGFITIKSKSGLVYQIHPGYGMTEVYDRGIMVDKLCVVLQGNFPPTDSLIMRYLLILNDEGEFSRIAIKHATRSVVSHVDLKLPKVRPLTDEWASIKGKSKKLLVA